MAAVSRSALPFLQRIGFRPTYAGPTPVVDLSALGTRDYPVQPVAVPAEWRIGQDGVPSPDRGPTGEWPFPTGAAGG